MPTAKRSPFRLVASATLLRRLPLWALRQSASGGHLTKPPEASRLHQQPADATPRVERDGVQ